MKNIYTILVSVYLISASFTANSACSVSLPIEELSDCIVVEGSGATYKKERDHIPTTTTKEIIVKSDDPSKATNIISIRESK